MITTSAKTTAIIPRATKRIQNLQDGEFPATLVSQKRRLLYLCRQRGEEPNYRETGKQRLTTEIRQDLVEQGQGANLKRDPEANLEQRSHYKPRKYFGRKHYLLGHGRMRNIQLVERRRQPRQDENRPNPRKAMLAPAGDGLGLVKGVELLQVVAGNLPTTTAVAGQILWLWLRMHGACP